MTYKFKNENNPKYFRDYIKPKELFTSLKDCNIQPKQALGNHKRFRLDLNEIRRGQRVQKLEEQKSLIKNAKMFYESREKITECFREHSFLLSEARKRKRTLTNSTNGKDSY